MLIKLNLRAINTEAHCVGQTNTYISSCGNSMIDYILLEEDLVPLVRHVEIALETPNNTAFQLPVIFHIEFNKMNETLSCCLALYARQFVNQGRHFHGCMVYNKKIKPFWSEKLNRLKKIA